MDNAVETSERPTAHESALSHLANAANAVVREGMDQFVACRWLAVMIQALTDKETDDAEV